MQFWLGGARIGRSRKALIVTSAILAGVGLIAGINWGSTQWHQAMSQRDNRWLDHSQARPRVSGLAVTQDSSGSRTRLTSRNRRRSQLPGQGLQISFVPTGTPTADTFLQRSRFKSDRQSGGWVASPELHSLFSIDTGSVEHDVKRVSRLQVHSAEPVRVRPLPMSTSSTAENRNRLHTQARKEMASPRSGATAGIRN